MAIPSREEYKPRIVQFIITPDNNPSIWTDEIFTELIHGEVSIGYIFKIKQVTFDTPVFILNLYTINPIYLETPDSVISLSALKGTYFQWLETLTKDQHSIIFRNPPIKEWLDAKEAWVMKLAYSLSKTYHKQFDDCMSTIYMIIMKCYNSGRVYMGNLTYIEIASHNAIKMEIRYMKNRLHGEHPYCVHLDATFEDFGMVSDDQPQSLHEIIGGQRDEHYVNEDYDAFREKVINDLLRKFSPREVDQILNNPRQLPLPLYKRFNAWRKSHKMEDYK